MKLTFSSWRQTVNNKEVNHELHWMTGESAEHSGWGGSTRRLYLSGDLKQWAMGMSGAEPSSQRQKLVPKHPEANPCLACWERAGRSLWLWPSQKGGQEVGTERSRWEDMSPWDLQGLGQRGKRSIYLWKGSSFEIPGGFLCLASEFTGFVSSDLLFRPC